MEALIIQTGSPPGPDGIALWQKYDVIYKIKHIKFLSSIF
jgi:hypothetical protein